MISVIIPTYNRAQVLARCLDSILAQTYSNWECVLVDDGSTDETFEICRNYALKDVHVIQVIPDYLYNVVYIAGSLRGTRRNCIYVQRRQSNG